MSHLSKLPNRPLCVQHKDGWRIAADQSADKYREGGRS